MGALVVLVFQSFQYHGYEGRTKMKKFSGRYQVSCSKSVPLAFTEVAARVEPFETSTLFDSVMLPQSRPLKYSLTISSLGIKAVF